MPFGEVDFKVEFPQACSRSSAVAVPFIVSRMRYTARRFRMAGIAFAVKS
jgi:hypothetical protein